MSTPNSNSQLPSHLAVWKLEVWQMSLLWVFCLLPFTFLGAAGTTVDIASAKLTLAMKHYANPPTAKFPWDR